MRDPTTPTAAGQSVVKPDRGAESKGALRRGSGRRFVAIVGRATEGTTPPALRGPLDAPAPGPPAARSSPSVAAAHGVARVLMGGAAGAPEARIRIGDGAGGGAEIRLSCRPAGREITVEVLTAAAGSRDTLTGVMNEVRLRLRRRGIALTDVGAGEPAAGREQGQGRTR